MKSLEYLPLDVHIKLQIIYFLYVKIDSEIEGKDIMENIKVDKNYLSKLLSTLVVESLIKKNPVVRRIKKTDSYFTIVLTKKGIRYARGIISVVSNETRLPEN